jgi:hypothetical protein
MSQLLNALKTIDQTADADAMAIGPSPRPEAPPEIDTAPATSLSVEELTEETGGEVDEEVGEEINGDAIVELPEGPDIVWPPTVVETVVETVIKTVIEDDETPAVQEVADDTIADESIAEDTIADDDDLPSQDAVAVAPHDEIPKNDEPDTDVSSLGVQYLSEAVQESIIPRIIVPHVPETYSADEDAVRLSDRILSQRPADQSVTIGLFRAGTTRSSRRVVGQLAAAISIRTGQAVLIIDVDAQPADRSPSIAGATPLGLGEVLLDGIDWSEAVVEVGHPPAEVSLLSPARRIESPVALSRLGLLLDKVRPHYRYILLDGGRADGSLATNMACFDGAYLVLGLDQTDRREAIAAASALGIAGIELAGCIVTHAA